MAIFKDEDEEREEALVQVKDAQQQWVRSPR